MHVQHLKGTGHQYRAATIARALAARGLEVIYVSGALPAEGDVEGVRLLSLPPVRAEGEGYRRLVDADGVPIDDAWRSRRCAALLAILQQTAPHVIVLETFPFGRRKLRFELLPLIEAAATAVPRPALVVSVRDVPEPRTDARERRAMVALAERWFDRVLVHGDGAVVRLEDTFPEARAIASLVVHTGYVVDHRAQRITSTEGRGEVVVSAGGGAAGGRLLEVALRAAPVDPVDGRRWRILVGPGAPDAVRAALGRQHGRRNGAQAHEMDRAGEHREQRLIVEPNREDFPGLLRHCEVSVSQAGYNTVLEVVHAGARALLVPHAACGEREQGIRARLFAARGLVRVLDPADLDPSRLAAAVDQAARRPRPVVAQQLDCAGAARSARIIEALARARAD
jgi:predicted glycosyltransferase